MAQNRTGAAHLSRLGSPLVGLRRRGGWRGGARGALWACPEGVAGGGRGSGAVAVRAGAAAARLELRRASLRG